MKARRQELLFVAYCPIVECFSTLGKPNMHAQVPFGPKKHWSFARARACFHDLWVINERCMICTFAEKTGVFWGPTVHKSVSRAMLLFCALWGRVSRVEGPSLLLLQATEQDLHARILWAVLVFAAAGVDALQGLPQTSAREKHAARWAATSSAFSLEMPSGRPRSSHG